MLGYLWEPCRVIKQRRQEFTCLKIEKEIGQSQKLKWHVLHQKYDDIFKSLSNDKTETKIENSLWLSMWDAIFFLIFDFYTKDVKSLLKIFSRLPFLLQHLTTYMKSVYTVRGEDKNTGPRNNN